MLKLTELLSAGHNSGLYNNSRNFKAALYTIVQRKIRTYLDLLSIPQSGGKNVKTFRWDHRLQIQNLFMAFKRVRLLR